MSVEGGGSGPGPIEVERLALLAVSTGCVMLAVARQLTLFVVGAPCHRWETGSVKSVKSQSKEHVLTTDSKHFSISQPKEVKLRSIVIRDMSYGKNSTPTAIDCKSGSWLALAALAIIGNAGGISDSLGCVSIAWRSDWERQWRQLVWAEQSSDRY